MAGWRLEKKRGSDVVSVLLLLLGVLAAVVAVRARLLFHDTPRLRNVRSRRRHSNRRHCRPRFFHNPAPFQRQRVELCPLPPRTDLPPCSDQPPPTHTTPPTAPTLSPPLLSQPDPPCQLHGWWGGEEPYWCICENHKNPGFSYTPMTRAKNVLVYTTKIHKNKRNSYTPKKSKK